MAIAASSKGVHTTINRYIPRLLVIPALVLLIAIILLPAIRTVVMTFQKVTFGAEAEYVGISNVVGVLTDSVFQSALWHTFLFTMAVVVGQITLGLGAAVLMSRGFPFQKLFVSILMMPYAVTVVVAIIVWTYMLEPESGIINYLLSRALGIEGFTWIADRVATWIVIIVIQIWMRFPFSFLILYSSILGVPKELHDSARVDGANSWQTFAHVTLPVITPALMVAIIFRFIFAFRNFATVWILTEGGPLHRTELLSTLLYKQAFRYYEFGTAAATSLVLTILTFLVAIQYIRMMYKKMFVEKA